mgnify:CR=1 FL=1
MSDELFCEKHNKALDYPGLDTAPIVYNQKKETVDQEEAGRTCRMATITCVCGNKRAIVKMYQCLYCKVWMCHQCAEEHFGKTVAEHRAKGERR